MEMMMMMTMTTTMGMILVVVDGESVCTTLRGRRYGCKARAAAGADPSLHTNIY